MTEFEKGRLQGLREAAAMSRLKGKKYHQRAEMNFLKGFLDSAFIERQKREASGEINQAILAMTVADYKLTAEHRELIAELGN